MHNDRKSKLKQIALFSSILLVTLSCKNDAPVSKEPWMEQAQSEWPVFALTNEVSFEDTTHVDLANSFLVSTGYDTLGVSCKHIFMVFEKSPGLKAIDLGNRFKYWNMYPKNDKDNVVSINRLINENPNEQIGLFNTLKVRDWIIFEVDKQNLNLFPLKIRYTPVKANEIVYAVGWATNQSENTEPLLVRLQCYRNFGDYFYTQTLDTGVDPAGRSGSPVIDKNGYLVGIVSGAEGNLGVMGSVSYLKSVFDNYGIQYASSQ